jgi:hypothetical protein
VTCVLLAEVEIRHSRPIAPTRRVALGLRLLPTDPVPGWGAVLLGGMVAVSARCVEADMLPELYDLIDDLEAGRRIAQPRLRHRFQKDTVGLDRSRHSLIGEGEHVWFDFDDRAAPEVTLLGALYAASELPAAAHGPVFRALRKAVQWMRPTDAAFVAHMLGDDEVSSRWRGLPDDTRWALKVLGFGPRDEPDRDEILTRFRESVWVAHPDRGGDARDAGQRMTELLHARKILLT